MILGTDRSWGVKTNQEGAVAKQKFLQQTVALGDTKVCRLQEKFILQQSLNAV